MVALGLCPLNAHTRSEVSPSAVQCRTRPMVQAVRNPAPDARLSFQREELPHMSCFSLQRNDNYFLRTQHRSSPGRPVCEGARRWPHMLGSCPNHYRMGPQGGICRCTSSHREQRTHCVRGQVERLEKGIFPSLSKRGVRKPRLRADASQHGSSSTTPTGRVRVPGHWPVLNQRRKNSNSHWRISTTGVVELGETQSQRAFRWGSL